MKIILKDNKLRPCFNGRYITVKDGCFSVKRTKTEVPAEVEYSESFIWCNMPEAEPGDILLPDNQYRSQVFVILSDKRYLSIKYYDHDDSIRLCEWSMYEQPDKHSKYIKIIKG